MALSYIQGDARGKSFSSSIFRNNVTRAYASAFKVEKINEKQIFSLTKLPVGKVKVQKNRRFLIYSPPIQCLAAIRKINRILS